MNYIYPFEKLKVWNISRSLVKKVYLITNSFPDGEKYGLISQLRRVAISVSSNLAEGTTKPSYKEKVRYTETAFRA